ncbi:AGZA family xanthine/uracil permease-like MFS transporter [Clostridium beijerinckii]|uniref:AGZA family xanthine/uracil permease-like MFS transporter n=1 Tax=Clostridium beijerinckii TaxID=1520 RepID=A0A9Q5CJW0_CLOBE|nr:adenine permease AdeP [Clostridium beijerinckii]MBA2883392.1 AGZA family xanthine/uracil permease-like MFS transporter [Clostridium beijerinckii]MBA2898578.1 AGZA family xanthine/uracil permease-like MFS transporter [Clostridium beijerinckii]MBA2907979.1 AGZA family xanthine/uracil permease-like MFS transporter [Clostridium beijerinckii]MBA9013474.1 AGZA family xanthine/uracil permease-like MFS transporter [Clostridium beijerinckii]
MDNLLKKSVKTTEENGMLEKIFHLSKNKTTVKTEMLAGLTTFLTMAYILVVNPSILSQSGMDVSAVFTATALASFIGTVIMALIANYPFGMAPGMGLNALFTFTICLGMKFSWQTALAASLIEGFIFMALNIFKIRQVIIDSVPPTLKYAISIGIGFFITFIGLQDAKMIVANQATLVGIGNLKDPTVLLAGLGVIIISVLYYKNIKGSFIIGMFSVYVLGMIFGVAKVPTGIISMPPSVAPIFMQFDFKSAMVIGIIPAILSMLFIDVFDSIGTLIGLASKAGYLDEKGNVKNADKVLTADAIGSVVGACLGTSTPVAFVESAAGIAEGGRTGLAGLTIAGLFFLSLFFSPILTAIPGFATAPVLIVLGAVMMEPIAKVNFSDFTEGMPVFLTLILTLLTYSITDGLAFGFVSYVLIKLFTGKSKDIPVPMYFIALAFVGLFALM